MQSSNGMPVWIVDSPSVLLEAVESCRACARVALDSEFMRVRTFHAQPALFQLCDATACWLIDPLRIDDLAPLAQLLADRSVTKLMHSCGEDLEVCERRLGVLPDPLADTQLIAAFCGLGHSIGYQRAVAELLQVQLPKSETRTDWLQRPLSEAQMHYAADDVSFLHALHDELCRRLAATPERAHWAGEECAALLARQRTRDTREDYRGIGGAWRLDARALAVLRAVHGWRERRARERDLPRSWVLADAALLAIAERPPRDASTLASTAQLAPGTAHKYASSLLEAIEAAQSLGEAEWPALVPGPAGPAETRRLKSLRACVIEHAERLGVAPELLARRRELEELLRVAAAGKDPGSLAVMSGWRHELIGAALWKLAAGGA